MMNLWRWFKLQFPERIRTSSDRIDHLNLRVDTLLARVRALEEALDRIHAGAGADEQRRGWERQLEPSHRRMAKRPP
jgi:hypothetical protein